jgi:hypothetical protein
MTLGLVVALPATASADSFAVGGGATVSDPESDFPDFHFSFSAHCKSATGECPSGSGTASGYAVVSHPVFGKAQGHVCAAAVFPDVPGAAIGIVVEKGSGELGSFPFVQLIVADFGGEPPSGSPDLFAIVPEFDCHLGVGGGSGASPVVQGNIVVK